MNTIKFIINIPQVTLVLRIWIDLVNSPHIPFFVPIINRLNIQGHIVIITYRDFAQTAELVKLHKLDGVLIGSHGGKGKLFKLINLVQRTAQLYSFIKNKKIDLAISHNSYFQLVAAKILGIPSITSMDFEGQPANHLAFRLASLVSVPSVFPSSSLNKFGAKNITYYSGIKENICLADFNVLPDFINKIKKSFKLTDLDIKKPLVVVRPPPHLALYHNEDESLFDLFIDKISACALSVLVLPRTEEQKALMKAKYPMFFFSDDIIDGLQLIYYADAVVSGGGSMNREAACIGTPAYSFFSGKIPAVDKMLQQNSKLLVIKSKKQLDDIVFKKKEHFTVIKQNQNAINDFIEHVNNVLNKG